MNESFVVWTCNKCESLSDIPVDDFLDSKDGCKPVLATCENCGCDSFVTLKDIFTNNPSRLAEEIHSLTQ